MRTSQRGLDLIKRFEGCRLLAYDDGTGVWTIGYGHTRGVKRGQTTTQAQAEAYLREDLGAAERNVNSFGGKYHWSQNQFDALVSFAFNIGSINQLTGNGTRSIQEISQSIPLYNKAGGRVLRGLVTRRAEEKALFDAGGGDTDRQQQQQPQPPPPPPPPQDIHIHLQADNGRVLPPVMDGNDNAGIDAPMRYLAAWCDGAELVVRANALGELVNPSNIHDHARGCVGDGSPITRLYMYLRAPRRDRRVWYRVKTQRSGWLPWMKDNIDTSGSRDTFAGDGSPIYRVDAHIGPL